MGCSENDEPVLAGRDRIHNLPGEFQIVRCQSCGLMRTNPRPTPDTIGFYYPQDYAPYHTAPPSPSAPRRPKPLNFRRRLRARYRRWLGLEDSHALPVSAPGRLLEIGCANGSYLMQAQAQGWSVNGIEFSPVAAASARKAGLDVVSAPIEKVSPPTEPYDIIVGWMVFEHVHRPQDVLRMLHAWVRRDGWLVLSLPDAGAAEFRWFRHRWYALHLPNHMTHFTAATAKALLAHTGWKVEHVIWQQNPNNLLHCIRYWAMDHGHPRLSALMQDMVNGKRWQWLHGRLCKWMAITHQSGRMTLWARRVDRA